MIDFKNLPNCPFCGTPPDDMFESDGRVFCVPCDITVQIEDWKNVNKIKAEAVREYARSRGLADCEAINHANKLEKGEL